MAAVKNGRPLRGGSTALQRPQAGHFAKLFNPYFCWSIINRNFLLLRIFPLAFGSLKKRSRLALLAMFQASLPVALLRFRSAISHCCATRLGSVPALTTLRATRFVNFAGAYMAAPSAALGICRSFRLASAD